MGEILLGIFLHRWSLPNDRYMNFYLPTILGRIPFASIDLYVRRISQFKACLWKPCFPDVIICCGEGIQYAFVCKDSILLCRHVDLFHAIGNRSIVWNLKGCCIMKVIRKCFFFLGRPTETIDSIIACITNEMFPFKKFVPKQANCVGTLKIIVFSLSKSPRNLLSCEGFCLSIG